MAELSTQELTMYEGEVKTLPHTWTEKVSGNPANVQEMGEALKAVIDNKLVPYESALVTIPANGSYSLVHGRKLYSAPMILDGSGIVKSP